MTPLSISTAWNETTAFVKREAGLLFPIALAFLAIPAILFQFSMPQVEPGKTPEPGAWMLFILPLAVVTMLGSVAISRLAIVPSQSVRDAIGHGMRRLLPLVGAVVLLTLAAFIALVPLTLIIGVLGLDQRMTTLLMALIFLALLTFVWVRFLLVTPIAAAEPAGAVAILQRSWRLTAGHFNKLIWSMTAFAIAAAIALLAVSLAVGTVLALLLGAPAPGSISYVLTLIIDGVLNALLAIYMNVLIARIYVQLAGGSTSGI